MKTAVRNGRVLDVHTGTFAEKTIVIEGDTISALLGPSLPPGDDCVIIDAQGACILPGLIDAHVHVTSATVDLATPQLPITYATCCAARHLKEALHRGFTTLRDAGGADFGLAMAVDEDVVEGSRLFYCGRALSQTGGHGDFRAMTYDGEYGAPMQSAASTLGQVVDGVTEVRRACRAELRKGASFIKIMASGGVASLGDKITDTQFSHEELAAIVEEARSRSVYAAAHAYSPKAIQICLQHGVTSVEHGNLLDDETAIMMHEKGAFLIPTVITYDALSRRGAAFGFPAESIAKLAFVREQALDAIVTARKHQVRVGFGTDLLGTLWEEQSGEFLIRSSIERPIDTIRSATLINAELINAKGRLGELSPHAWADLLIVAGNPVDDIALLVDPNNIKLIMKAGKVYKNTL